MPVEVIGRAERERRAAAHEARLRPLVAPHLERRRSGVKHPVHDFLFTYYSQRPAQLLRWHPGYGVALEVDADDPAGAAYAGLKGYATRDDGTVAVTEAYVAGQRPLLEATRRLLAATLGRPAQLGCFGLHEWAMVHRLAEDETRHADWPLRLGPEGTDAVVEGHRIACSHFDAYRFFTPSAVGLNTLSPAADDRAAFEQPGCLHAGMDLYKHAFRLTPMVCSDLVADCFELARDIRELDMRAAPYDLTGLEIDGRPFIPVRIETAEGKRAYAAAQEEFAERGRPLRERLVAACEDLLTVVGADL